MFNLYNNAKNDNDCSTFSILFRGIGNLESTRAQESTSEDQLISDYYKMQTISPYASNGEVIKGKYI